jgi:hypothetical protein
MALRLARWHIAYASPNAYAFNKNRYSALDIALLGASLSFD